jgi:hypothetical protein
MNARPARSRPNGYRKNSLHLSRKYCNLNTLTSPYLFVDGKFAHMLSDLDSSRNGSFNTVRSGFMKMSALERRSFLATVTLKTLLVSNFLLHPEEFFRNRSAPFYGTRAA